MADESDQAGWMTLGVTAELTKRYVEDQRAFLPLLATMLTSALPEETTLEHRGGLFGKKTLERIEVELGEHRYRLEDPGRGPLRTTRVHVVRGIALKTEQLPVEEWVAELGTAIEERAQRSAAAREALAKLIG